jgi:hypothetical protein
MLIDTEILILILFNGRRRLKDGGVSVDGASREGRRGGDSTATGYGWRRWRGGYDRLELFNVARKGRRGWWRWNPGFHFTTVRTGIMLFIDSRIETLTHRHENTLTPSFLIHNALFQIIFVERKDR